MSALFPGNVPQEHHHHRGTSSGCTHSGHLPGVFMARNQQHRTGGIAAQCRARHASVLVAAHVAIRHMTTANGIRSTADTITAAPDTTTTGRHVPHVLTSPTACRPHSNFQLPHVRPRSRQHQTSQPQERDRQTSEHVHVSRLSATIRPKQRTPAKMERQHPDNVPTSTLPQLPPVQRTRPRFTQYTATATRTPRHKKAPTRHFLLWGLLSYSVTSFTISSAVFPSAALRNFALSSPRFISGILVSISSTIRPIRLSIVFSLSNAAKQ